MNNISLNGVVLESVNLVVDDEGMAHPIEFDNNVNMTEDVAVHISNVSDDVLGHMTNEDMESMIDFLYQFEDSDFMLNYLDWSQTFVGWVRNNNALVDDLMSHLLAGGTI